MSTSDPREDQIKQSWRANAEPWARAIRAGAVGSRERVTNDAVGAAILESDPKSVLDVGCGEGWLGRRLSSSGISVVGIDGEPALIAAAREGGGGHYAVMDYELLCDPEAVRTELARIGAPSLTKFDAVVFNFSLIGELSAKAALAGATQLVEAHGQLVIQTLHPESTNALPGNASAGGARRRNDVDGWRQGSWVGFEHLGFDQPAPWYYRSLESWKQLLSKVGLSITDLQEHRDPESGVPASLIFVCRLEDRPDH